MRSPTCLALLALAVLACDYPMAPALGPDPCVELIDLDGDGLSCDDWIQIFPAQYLVGSPPGTDYAGTDETYHRIQLTRSLWIARIELPAADGLPMVMDWPQAVDWIDGINQAEGWPLRVVDVDGDGLVDHFTHGHGYRLPTEGEWETAAKAGEGFPEVPGGGCEAYTIPGWYCGNSGGSLHRVGQQAPNLWGFQDMQGNAPEWVWDWYGPYPQPASGRALVEPQGPRTGSYKVIKGGGYDSWADKLRPADRSGCAPGLGCQGAIRLAFQL